MSEIGLWHAMEKSQPTRLLAEALPSEKDLENWIFDDPTLLSPSLHRVRRQVPLGLKLMDILAIEEPGIWVVCELKKTDLYRDSLTQAIDYVARLDRLSLEELESLVNQVNNTHRSETRKLINKALDREKNGEERSIRIVLAGVGVREDLQVMIDFLNSKYEFPISICTFSAVSAPGDDQGIILMRDISDDTQNEIQENQGSAEYADRLLGVRNHFKSPLQAAIFDEFSKIFSEQTNLFVRPWKKSIMIAPHQHHGRYLAYFTANRGGVKAMVGTEAILEFFPDADISHITTQMKELVFDNLESAKKWANSVAQTVANVSSQSSANSSVWNEKDWYFSFGEGSTRKWEDAVKFGFVSAGGGDFYSKTVRPLPVGARVFAYIPNIGYVGVGTTTGPAVNYQESNFWKQHKLSGRYAHENGEPEYIVPVSWIKTLELDDAIYGNGVFANQHSACRLKDKKTLKILAEKFGVPYIELET